jgi:hypothetical protein
MIARGERRALAAELLDAHYDPCYRRAMQHNFPRYRNAPVMRVGDTSTDAFRTLARQLLNRPAAPRAA